jgi:hypothetical protein
MKNAGKQDENIKNEDFSEKNSKRKSFPTTMVLTVYGEYIIII